jgi:hypothetical protein
MSRCWLASSGSHRCARQSWLRSQGTSAKRFEPALGCWTQWTRNSRADSRRLRELVLLQCGHSITVRTRVRTCRQQDQCVVGSGRGGGWLLVLVLIRPRVATQPCQQHQSKRTESKPSRKSTHAPRELSHMHPRQSPVPPTRDSHKASRAPLLGHNALAPLSNERASKRSRIRSPAGRERKKILSKLAMVWMDVLMTSPRSKAARSASYSLWSPVVVARTQPSNQTATACSDHHVCCRNNTLHLQFNAALGAVHRTLEQVHAI